MLTASALYAQVQYARFEGEEFCHWCNSPCSRKWLHDEPPMALFIRSPGLAKRPSSPFICVACWLYRRRKVTVTTLGGKQIDGQCLMNHDWYMTPEDVRVILPEDHELLYEILLDPPLVFSLSMHEKGVGIKNQLQLGVVNQNTEIVAGVTTLQWTYNNKPLEWTVYDLEEGLRLGIEGKPPGVRTLVQTLGAFEFKREGDGVKRERGRPRKVENAEERAVIRKVK